jgi:hypothetical protein
MSCEHVICASCAGPVVEGRCPTCRTARAHIHHTPLVTTPQLVAALVAVLVALALMAHLLH